jgi:hypothetical protein
MYGENRGTASRLQVWVNGSHREVQSTAHRNYFVKFGIVPLPELQPIEMPAPNRPLRSLSDADQIGG